METLDSNLSHNLCERKVRLYVPTLVGRRPLEFYHISFHKNLSKINLIKSKPNALPENLNKKF